MSQIIFKTITPELGPIEIMAGWDVPMREYFLTVFKDDADETVVWSQMHKPLPIDKVNTDRLVAKLVELGITAPDGFWELVHKQEGNARYVHNAQEGWK